MERQFWKGRNLFLTLLAVQHHSSHDASTVLGLCCREGPLWFTAAGYEHWFTVSVSRCVLTWWKRGGSSLGFLLKGH